VRQATEKSFVLAPAYVKSTASVSAFNTEEKQWNENSHTDSQRRVLHHSIIAFLVTAIAAQIPSLSFSGFLTEQPFSRIWLLISDSGAQWGIVFILLLATALVASKHTGLKVRTFKAVQFFTGLFAILLCFALVNEFLTKPAVGKHRPFIIKLEKEGLLVGQKLYNKGGKPERTQFLEKLFKENANHPLIQSVHPLIRRHWEAQTGFSFPSGHSQNAFLFAIILGYLISELIPNGRRWIWIPFLWAGAICLSRVALGVHSPLDITIGALTGGLIGGLILKLGVINKLIR
tara:strand:+ start:1351 stop:2217 length:867 start_codon:yes stop_codon:yes gene_type:complete